MLLLGLPAVRRHLIILLLVQLSACMQSSAPQSVSLPPDAVQGVGDPTRSAIITAANVFAAPSSIAGQPALAARAAAQLEYLAVKIPTGPRWVGFSPVVSLEFNKARAELRSALGIDPTAPPQGVIDSLYATSRALTAGDHAAMERILAPPIYRDGAAATLQRLSALPLLPHANFATSLAAAEMNRLDDNGRRGFGGFGGFRF